MMPPGQAPAGTFRPAVLVWLLLACASLLQAAEAAAPEVSRARCLCGFVVGDGYWPPRMPLVVARPRTPWGAGRRREVDAPLSLLARGVTTGATTQYVSG